MRKESGKESETDVLEEWAGNHAIMVRGEREIVG